MTETITYDRVEAQDYFARKVAFTTGPVEVKHQLDAGDNINVIDVREADDFQRGHVPGAFNLPQDQWGAPTSLQEDKMNILYCYSPTCHLAAKAAVRFAGEGFPVMEMDGGFEAWKKNQFQIAM